MSKLSRVLLVVGIVVVAGGSAILYKWEPPAPTGRVEKVIANDRFPR